MKFTYESYLGLIDTLRKKDYSIKNYYNYQNVENRKLAILRHDVDFSLERAVIISDLEKEIGVDSTYFILVATDFYNIHTLDNRRLIDRILSNGSSIGLHFDEVQYSIDSEEELIERILCEKKVLSEVCSGAEINVVSMHRPSTRFLQSNLNIPGMINAYDSIFFNKMKYVSDSRRCWREDINQIIDSGCYNELVILTHPFWYRDEEVSLEEAITAFVDEAKRDRVISLNDNFKNLNEVIDIGKYGI